MNFNFDGDGDSLMGIAGGQVAGRVPFHIDSTGTGRVRATSNCDVWQPCSLHRLEGAAHHHLMWLNSDTTAHVDGEAHNYSDDRTWACSCVGNCNALVGTWDCHGFTTVPL
mmetsp:Transcript_23987/g.66207  ORF Transcript_23987/g.66207 Transcript_23987/m.66207 type:complete len:111 (-) Transcript_23987:550-882(-)